MQAEIPEVVVSRLPMYVRALTELQEEGVEFVSSADLSARFGMTSAQVRKDLSYFGRFGRQGRGYSVSHLIEKLGHILGLDRQWSMAVVGMGRLGRAILDYHAFLPRGFTIVVAFHKGGRLVGRKVSGVEVEDVARLEQVVKERGVDIAIVAVPASEAQVVIKKLVECGIKAILNYAPVSARVPPGVRLRGIDPVVALESMTYYLAKSGGSPE